LPVTSSLEQLLPSVLNKYMDDFGGQELVLHPHYQQQGAGHSCWHP